MGRLYPVTRAYNVKENLSFTQKSSHAAQLSAFLTPLSFWDYWVMAPYIFLT